ncbi:hypothetical protein [Neobacillus ginsengisoli]|nr:hypothetical protein [Neobacillus ginsengisoli]
MKSQRLPEHELNVTTPVGQAVEKMTATDSSKSCTSEKTESQTLIPNEEK